MADLRHFLDFSGLAEYDRLMKEYVDKASKEGLSSELEELATKNNLQDEQLELINKALSVLNSDDSIAGSVDAKIKKAMEDLVDGAPEALDTLKEVADWIASDEEGTTSLVSKIQQTEAAIKENENAIKDLQEVDVLKNISAIQELEIMGLFPTAQRADQSVADALAEVEEGKAVKLAPNQDIADDLVISKSCYIDANGATFTGTVTIPKNVDVIVENATFTRPVVVA